MRVYENGVYRDITPGEQAELELINADAFTEFLNDMSTASTVAQMRSAAKSFLSKTEVSGGEY